MDWIDIGGAAGVQCYTYGDFNIAVILTTRLGDTEHRFTSLTSLGAPYIKASGPKLCRNFFV